MALVEHYCICHGTIVKGEFVKVSLETLARPNLLRAAAAKQEVGSH